jgi:hypothetical protein
MGHSSNQVTVDRYGHFIPGKNRGAVERLAAATSQPTGQLERAPAHSNFDATKTPRRLIDSVQEVLDFLVPPG